MTSLFNCKVAAILALDPECIFVFKLWLSCSVIWMALLSDPMVSSLPLLGWGYDFPKIDIRGGMQNNSLKQCGMPKRGKYHKCWDCGKCLKCQNLLCENQNKNNLLIKEIRTISTFFKIGKDFQKFEILNLIVNFTKV